MRIVENNAQRLILRDRALWISWVCFALGSIAFGHFAIARGDPRQLIPGALFVVFGAAFLRATDVVFDKAQRRCAIRRRDVWRVTGAEMPFDDIVDVRVEPMHAADDSGAISCRLTLVTASATLPLTATYQPSLQRFEAMRETVAEVLFAGRAEPAAEDPVLTLLRAGRFIDAVAFLRQRDGLGLAAARTRVQEMKQAAGF